jgi:perosamine synthetase
MFVNEEIGWKYKMSAMQAALGLAQLERLDELVGGKRRIFSWYREALSNWNAGVLNPDVDGLYNSYWMTTVVLNCELGLAKERVISELRARGVEARPFFNPLSALPAFRDQPQTRAARLHNRTAYAISPYGINLPSALSLEQHDVERVCEVLQGIVGADGAL